MSHGDAARSSLVMRMVGAARLDRATYEEVEHDRGATMQAASVVVATSIAAGIGALSTEGPQAFVGYTAAGLAGWAVYAWLTYIIGTRIFATSETSADWGELARTLGFASAPRMLLLLGLVPGLLGVVSFVVSIWVILTTIVALKAALDFGTGRAIGTGLLGVIAQGIIFAIVWGILGG